MNNYNDKNSKERIMLAAVKLFAKKGFDGASTREISAEANVNLCMISYYFGGKKELYNAIINEIIEKQTEYLKKFCQSEENLKLLSKSEKIDLLFQFINSSVDFFYSNVTSDLVLFLLRAQQDSSFTIKSPSFDFLRKLMALIFEKEPDDKNIIFKTLFILAQINCSRVFPYFSLKLAKQSDLTADDILMIKMNVKNYITMLLKEEKIV